MILHPCLSSIRPVHHLTVIQQQQAAEAAAEDAQTVKSKSRPGTWMRFFERRLPMITPTTTRQQQRNEHNDEDAKDKCPLQRCLKNNRQESHWRETHWAYTYTSCFICVIPLNPVQESERKSIVDRKGLSESIGIHLWWLHSSSLPSALCAREFFGNIRYCHTVLTTAGTLETLHSEFSFIDECKDRPIDERNKTQGSFFLSKTVERITSTTKCTCTVIRVAS